MPKLYPEDQARVDQVLSEANYREDRPPFRFWRLLGLLALTLLLVSLVSVVLGWYHGFI